MSHPPLADAPYDLVVIGAGVNGLGITQDATLRGLRVALLEQDDLCSGVSAWSGRLIHGGLRYLEQYDLRLVRESLRERERLFRLAPHLVKPIPFMVPFYRQNRRRPWLMRLGMLLYDVLSFDKSVPRHHVLSAEQALRRFPGMCPDGLLGAAVFFDGQVEYSERLCVELGVDAQTHGAAICTHTRVDAPLMEEGRVVGVRCTDMLSGAQRQVYGRLVMNAAGPWIDRVLAAPDVPAQPRLNGGTKGSHLIIGSFPGAPSDVVYYESQRDGRLVLVIPWTGRYLIGTTDIRFEEDPADARCDIGEAEYLLAEVNRLIPRANLTVSDVLFTYSGVRPLPYKPDSAESSVPRSHVAFDHSQTGLPGLVTVVGGKFTTYRQLAEDTVDDAFRRLARTSPPCPTRERKLPGAQRGDPASLAGDFAARTGLPEHSALRLIRLYGSRADEVWALAEQTPDLRAMVGPASGLIAAELIFAVQCELACTLTDVLARRVLLAFEADHGLSCLDQIVSIIGDHLRWDAGRRRSEVAQYRSWLERLAVPATTGPRSVSFGAGRASGR